MKKLRVFKCNNCSDKEELLIEDSRNAVFCASCGGVAVKTLSAPKYFNNTVGKSPSAR
jgi:uncharacterized Zn finger protein